jgi:glucuronate isomerase
MAYLRKLEKASGTVIKDMDSLLNALQLRVDYFHNNGCRVADHGLAVMPPATGLKNSSANKLKRFIKDKHAVYSKPEDFSGHLLIELCKMYHAKGWVQQFHLGALRNTNSRMLRTIGPDGGFDSIGDCDQGKRLSAFLNKLDHTDQLSRTILYNLNPADNELFAAMSGNFNNSEIIGKVQYGAAWWFLDQQDGIKKQLKTLANISLISTFIGMTTDSRSFLSYSRHEYFRRILCNLLGNDIEKGAIPNDMVWIGSMVKDICYYNAKSANRSPTSFLRVGC